MFNVQILEWTFLNPTFLYADFKKRAFFCNWKLKLAPSIFRAAALMATRSRPAATYSVAPERTAIRYSNSR